MNKKSCFTHPLAACDKQCSCETTGTQCGGHSRILAVSQGSGDRITPRNLHTFSFSVLTQITQQSDASQTDHFMTMKPNKAVRAHLTD